MIHKAVSIAQPGDVLVISIRNDDHSGAWGEILTTAAMVAGIVGVVSDGAVRDAAAAKKKKFPVFSRGLSVGATMKKNLGLINHPIVCGNVLVEPGDIVLGDVDGVVVVPQARAEEILAASIDRERREAAMMEKLKRGVTTLEILGLNAVLTELGMEEE